MVNMRDFPEQFKVVDAAGKNVATNFTQPRSSRELYRLLQTHPFPPEDTNPVPEPGLPNPNPTPTPTPGSGTDKNGVKLLVADGSEIEYK